MNQCANCNHLFEAGEEKHWEERHGFTHGQFEQFSGCPVCGEGYIEVKPCAICGDYPSEEYEDKETLPHGGVCQECFDKGIRAHFMEYLESLDYDDQRDFYFGKCKGGYAYDSMDMLFMAQDDYKKRIKLHEYIFGVTHEAITWTNFVNDSDPHHFSTWLIGRVKNYVKV